MILLSFCTVLIIQSCKDSNQIEDPVINNIDPIADFGWTGFQVAPAELAFTNSSINSDSFNWDLATEPMPLNVHQVRSSLELLVAMTYYLLPLMEIKNP